MADNYTPAEIITPEPLLPSSAKTFRDTLNANFTSMKTNAQNVSDTVTVLNNELAPVAKSGLASQITTDPEHKFVTDNQIATWNLKTHLDTTENKLIQNNVDITAAVQAFFNGQWKPTNTSQFINDSDFLTTSASFTTYKVIYLENQVANRYEYPSGTFPKDGEIGTEFPWCWYINLSNSSGESCTPEMTPTVVFNQDDSMYGNFSPVCQSGNGVVYIWSRQNAAQPTVKAVYAVQSLRLSPVTQQETQLP